MTLSTLPIDFSAFDHSEFVRAASARLLMACAMGSIVGMEREWRHKASGLRTNMMLCMGCALFTIMSGVLAGADTPDKSRVASNIVQGIGFLGAGLILHTRNRVLGLTSAATVFVVASIGMTFGAGLYAEAAISTAIVFVALHFIGVLEARVDWKSYPMLYEVRGSDQDRMLMEILAVLDHERIRLDIVDRGRIGALERITFSVSACQSKHKQVLERLTAAADSDLTVVAFDQDEED